MVASVLCFVCALPNLFCILEYRLLQQTGVQLKAQQAHISPRDWLMMRLYCKELRMIM